MREYFPCDAGDGESPFLRPGVMQARTQSRGEFLFLHQMDAETGSGPVEAHPAEPGASPQKTSQGARKPPFFFPVRIHKEAVERGLPVRYGGEGHILKSELNPAGIKGRLRKHIDSAPGLPVPVKPVPVRVDEAVRSHMNGVKGDFPGRDSGRGRGEDREEQQEDARRQTPLFFSGGHSGVSRFPPKSGMPPVFVILLPGRIPLHELHPAVEQPLLRSPRRRCTADFIQ